MHLTAREREILKWITQGKTNPEIAQIIDRSEQTVKNQVSGILGKLGVENRGQAMSVALDHGWVPPGSATAI